MDPFDSLEPFSHEENDLWPLGFDEDVSAGTFFNAFEFVEKCESCLESLPVPSVFSCAHNTERRHYAHVECLQKLQTKDTSRPCAFCLEPFFSPMTPITPITPISASAVERAAAAANSFASVSPPSSPFCKHNAKRRARLAERERDDICKRSKLVKLSKRTDKEKEPATSTQETETEFILPSYSQIRTLSDFCSNDPDSKSSRKIKEVDHDFELKPCSMQKTEKRFSGTIFVTNAQLVQSPSIENIPKAALSAFATILPISGFLTLLGFSWDVTITHAFYQNGFMCFVMLFNGDFHIVSQFIASALHIFCQVKDLINNQDEVYKGHRPRTIDTFGICRKPGSRTVLSRLLPCCISSPKQCDDHRKAVNDLITGKSGRKYMNLFVSLRRTNARPSSLNEKMTKDELQALHSLANVYAPNKWRDVPEKVTTCQSSSCPCDSIVQGLRSFISSNRKTPRKVAMQMILSTVRSAVMSDPLLSDYFLRTKRDLVPGVHYYPKKDVFPS